MAEQAGTWKSAETVLDVRPDLESSGEPFVRIMEAVAAIKPGGTLASSVSVDSLTKQL